MEGTSQTLLVAGASCVGKSTFVENMRRGRFPEFARELGLDSLSGWTSVYSKDVDGLDPSAHDRLLVHYALPFQALHRRTLAGFEHDRRLRFLAGTQSLTILSLRANPEEIRGRIHRRIARCLFTGMKRPWSSAPRREFRRLMDLRKLYADPQFDPDAMWRRWVRYCESVSPAEHIQIELSAAPRLLARRFGRAGRPYPAARAPTLGHQSI